MDRRWSYQNSKSDLRTVYLRSCPAVEQRAHVCPVFAVTEVSRMKKSHSPLSLSFSLSCLPLFNACLFASHALYFPLLKKPPPSLPHRILPLLPPSSTSLYPSSSSSSFNRLALEPRAAARRAWGGPSTPIEQSGKSKSWWSMSRTLPPAPMRSPNRSAPASGWKLRGAAADARRGNAGPRPDRARPGPSASSAKSCPSTRTRGLHRVRAQRRRCLLAPTLRLVGIRGCS